VNAWRLEGYDTFEGEFYPLDGSYETKELAIAAAKDRLKALEKSQPSASSGGQGFGGIQDRVFVVGPDGKRVRI